LNSYRSLSKSKYINGLQCLKLLWVQINEPSRMPPTPPTTQNVFDQGHEVGFLAQKLFPGGISLQTEDIGKNLGETKASLNLRKPIFEAGFSANRLYCRVDILNPAGEDAWDIVEVKSTNSVKEEQMEDVAFQHHCCQMAGLKINRCFVMHLNGDYVRRGEIDLNELFIIEDVTDHMDGPANGLEERITSMLDAIGLDVCPEETIGGHCGSPYGCLLHDECWAHLPEHHIFTMNRIGAKAEELLAQGILDIKDIPPSFRLNEKQLIQQQCVVCGKPHIRASEIKMFLDSLEYPIYFMDFETFETAVPMFDNVSPHQPVPFQFSVHIIDSLESDPLHISYLGEGKDDPRPAFLLELKRAIGSKGSIVVYNQTFEKTRLRELTEAFPRYKEWVDGVLERITDLWVPFRNFSYYHPSQKGSASLKKVMPAVAGVSYDELEIAEGQTASLKYMKSEFGDLPEDERQKIRTGLEVYCGQDTGGMIEIVKGLSAF
jgi:Domain of unknown function(DUF2779)